MGKKSDDAQNLVEEKIDDQTISSNASSSRRKRREKSRKSKDGSEMASGSKQEIDKDSDPDMADIQEKKETNSGKKRPRDKRRKKEHIIEAEKKPAQKICDGRIV